MRRSTAILIGVLALAALIAGGAAFVRDRHESKEAELIAACEKDARAPSGDPFPG